MIPNLQPYPKYKEVYIPWLEKIPESWKIKRGKTVFKCIDIRSDEGKEELLTVSSNKGVVPRKSTTVTMFKAESYVGYKLCWPDDLAINSLWAWAGGLGVSQHHGIISSAYGVYRLKAEAKSEPQYIHELVRSVPFQWELKVRSKGIWTSRLQLTDLSFLEAPFPIPPIEEQTAIVRYLNYTNNRIQQYIATKQKLIKLLEEQKQTIIHLAVTGAIDVRTGRPYPKYKDSEVELLGKVPESWDVKKLKNIARMLVSNVDKHTYEGEIPARLCNYVDVYKNERITKKIEFMSATVTPDELKSFKLRVGDVIITKDSEVWTDIGVPALVEFIADDLVCGYHLAIIRPNGNNKVIGEFVLRLLQDNFVVTQLHISANGVTRYGLSHGDIKNILLPVPSILEQEAIVNFINMELTRLGRTINRAKSEIDLLKEYRTRLTADIVTGKVDVREIAKNLPAAVSDHITDDTDNENMGNDEMLSEIIEE